MNRNKIIEVRNKIAEGIGRQDVLLCHSALTQLDYLISEKPSHPPTTQPAESRGKGLKTYTTKEVWDMYAKDPLYATNSYHQFATENKWAMVKLDESPSPLTSEDIRQMAQAYFSNPKNKRRSTQGFAETDDEMRLRIFIAGAGATGKATPPLT